MKTARTTTYIRTIFGALLLIMSIGCASHRSPTINLSSAGLEPVDFQVPTPDSWQLPNGLTVMFRQDNELPLIRGSLYLKGGTLWEPADHLGSVSATGEQMRQGGAGPRSADELDAELEKLSASVGSAFAEEYGKISFGCLSSDIEQVFSIFADVALRPRFEKDRLNLWKGQALEGIRRRTDDPNTVAGIAFEQLLYGDTPYGAVVVEDDIKKLTQNDLRAMHRKLVRPRGAILAISGKIERAMLERLVQEKFGGWENAEEDLPPAPAVTFEPTPAVYFISLPFTQSTVYAGELGVPRFTDDFIEIDAFNQIFGTRDFSSLLFKRIRTELGLAYGTYGGIFAGVVRGKNIIALQTKAESTSQALVESLEILAKTQHTEVEQTELQEVLRSVRNAFIFRFDTPENVVDRAASLKLLNYPPDYDQTYISKILAVSTADVRNVARRRWDLSRFVIVVVGNETAYTAIQALMAEPPDVLKGYSLRKVRFDQKVVF